MPIPARTGLLHALDARDFQRDAHLHAAIGEHALDHLPHARARFTQHERIAADDIERRRITPVRERMAVRHDRDDFVLAPRRHRGAQRQIVIGF